MSELVALLANVIETHLGLSLFADRFRPAFGISFGTERESGEISKRRAMDKFGHEYVSKYILKRLSVCNEEINP